MRIKLKRKIMIPDFREKYILYLVGTINSIKVQAQAEAIVLSELIYV